MLGLSKPVIRKVLSRGVKWSVKYAPQILTAVGTCGLIGAIALTAKAAPNVAAKVDEMKEQKQTDILTVKEVAVETWRDWAPVAVLTAVSVACLIGSQQVGEKRFRMLTTAYTILEAKYDEFEDKVEKAVGQDKMYDIQSGRAQNVQNNQVTEQTNAQPAEQAKIIVIDEEGSRFKEPITGRYLRTTAEKIKAAVNVMNERMLDDIDNEVSLNDFFDEIGLETTDNDLYWSLTGDHKTGKVDIRFESTLTEDGKGTILIEYVNKPRHRGYSRW